MKSNFLLLALCFVSFQSFGQTPTTPVSAPKINNQIIVSFSAASSAAERLSIIYSLGRPVQGVDLFSGAVQEDVLINVPFYPVVVDGYTYNSEIELIGSLNGQHANVDNTNLNYTVKAEAFTFNQFLGNAGMSNYSPIDATCEGAYPGGPLVGQGTFDGEPIRVGILDTGLDPYYSEINNYVVGEANVLADDNNIGEIQINFDYDPSTAVSVDGNGHGTAVAGIIAGLTNRAAVSSEQMQLVIIKCFDDNGDANLYNIMQAIRVAKLFNLDVINLSWSFLLEEEDVNAHAVANMIRALSNEDGIIVVAGAGNDEKDLGTYDLAPAGLSNVNNMITVAGTAGSEDNCDGSLASFSNYGNPVEIAAPSASISAPGLNGFWSTNISGTSYAGPIVTAAVIQSWLVNEAVIANYAPSQGTHPICEHVINTATYVPSLAPYDIPGVVNFTNAVSIIPNYSFNIYNENTTLASIGREKAVSNMDKNHYANGFLAYPNPFSNQLIIRVPNNGNQNAHLEILNMQGQLVHSQLMFSTDGETKIALPKILPTGSYMLRLHNTNGTTSKVVVKN